MTETQKSEISDNWRGANDRCRLPRKEAWKVRRGENEEQSQQQIKG